MLFTAEIVKCQEASNPFVLSKLNCLTTSTVEFPLKFPTYSFSFTGQPVNIGPFSLEKVQTFELSAALNQLSQIHSTLLLDTAWYL